MEKIFSDEIPAETKKRVRSLPPAAFLGGPLLLLRSFRGATQTDRTQACDPGLPFPLDRDGEWIGGPAGGVPQGVPQVDRVQFLLHGVVPFLTIIFLSTNRKDAQGQVFSRKDVRQIGAPLPTIQGSAEEESVPRVQDPRPNDETMPSLQGQAQGTPALYHVSQGDSPARHAAEMSR
jgi:hypothetical protein